MTITAPTNIPTGTRRPVPVTGWTAGPLVLVDRDGDEWRDAGVTTSGETLLVCDHPQNLGDQGEGESYPWTPALVAANFGPLVPVAVSL